MLRQASSTLARSAASRLSARAALISSRGLATDAYMQTPESATTVLDTFKARRACAVLRTPTAEACPKAMGAAIDGGFDIVEFTLTTPGCLDQVSNFRAKYDGKVMVGCGTVMDIPDAKAAMDAGAEFLVAPVMVPEVVTWCALNNIVIIPGCQTPTEAYNAFKAGAPVQKIFPGVAGGHMWVKAVSAALPMLRLNPTSGVDLDNAVRCCPYFCSPLPTHPPPSRSPNSADDLYAVCSCSRRGISSRMAPPPSASSPTYSPLMRSRPATGTRSRPTLRRSWATSRRAACAPHKPS
jgi:2-dehydro-3-deoxyphosphogluconate aldolase/(4S)-4-hydroxy-2-oxoglutarate aldolase